MIIAKTYIDILPSSCSECKYYCKKYIEGYFYESICNINDVGIEVKVAKKRRPDWCPLIEVEDENLQ